MNRRQPLSNPPQKSVQRPIRAQTKAAQAALTKIARPNASITRHRLEKRRRADRLRHKLALDPTLLTRRLRGGQTLLHVAANGGHDEAVAVLLEVGADPLARNEAGYIPLFYAAQQDHEDCACLLAQALNKSQRALQRQLETQVEALATTPLTTSGNTRTPTTVAPPAMDSQTDGYQAGQRQVGLRQTRLRQTRLRQTRLRQTRLQLRRLEAALGDTLVACVRDDDLLGVQNLNAARMDLDARDSEGSTALHWAVTENRQEIVEYLVEFSADLNVPDAEGDRPLHLALLNADQAVFKMLLDNWFGSGADPWALNRAGHTAYDLACAQSQYEVMEWLEQWMSHPRWRAQWKSVLEAQGRASELQALERY